MPLIWLMYWLIPRIVTKYSSGRRRAIRAEIGKEGGTWLKTMQDFKRSAA